MLQFLAETIITLPDKKNVTIKKKKKKKKSISKYMN